MASLGKVNAETLMFFRVLYGAPGYRLSREEVIQEVARVVYPSRGFQSEMDLRRRKVPGYQEPKQGTKRWQEMLDTGRERIATDFVRNQVRPVRRNGRGEDALGCIMIDGDDLVLTPRGIERAELLGKLPADAFERMKLDRSKKFEPSIDLSTLLRPLSETEYEELRDSIKRFGQLSPIVKDEGGLIIDGRNRERACEELGITPLVTVVPWDTTGDEKVAMCLSMNMARRQVSLEERNEIMMHLYLAGWAQARLGKLFNLDQTYVSRCLKEVKDRLGVDTSERSGPGKNGHVRHSEVTKQEVLQLHADGLSNAEISRRTGMHRRTVAYTISARSEQDHAFSMNLPEDQAVKPEPKQKKTRHHRSKTPEPVPEGPELDGEPEAEDDFQPEPQQCVCPTCGGSGWLTTRSASNVVDL